MSVDFFPDNLEHAFLELETRAQIAEAESQGEVVEGEGGWPFLRLAGGVVDVPFPKEGIERLRRSPEDVRVVLFGLGLGHTFRALRAHGVIIAAIYEPDAGVARRFFEQGPSDLGETPLVTVLSDLENVWLQVTGDSTRIELVETPGYRAAFPEARSDLVARIGRLLERTLINDDTLGIRGRTWIEDVLENLPFLLSPSAHHLTGRFQGVPAFIVGAGPSLNQNVAELEEATAKGIVFAVNSSGKALDRAGVRPQAFGCLESIDVSHLFRHLSFIDDVVRIASFTAHPNVLRTGQGPLLTLYEHLPYIAPPFERFFSAPGIPVCASVTTALVALAVRMGCSPVVLVGQDLAYSGGRCYASGTVYEDSRVAVGSDGTLKHEWCETMVETHEAAGSHLIQGEPVEFVQAWGGDGEVPSVASFIQVRMWLERVALLLARSEGDLELVNATEGGAHVRGFADRRLRQVLDELPLRRISSADIVAAARADRPDITAADVDAFLIAEAAGLRVVATAADELGAAVGRVLAASGSPEDAAAARELRAVEQAETHLREVTRQSPWVEVWGYREITDAVRERPEESLLPPGTASLKREQRVSSAISRAALDLAALIESKRSRLSERAAS